MMIKLPIIIIRNKHMVMCDNSFVVGVTAHSSLSTTFYVLFPRLVSVNTSGQAIVFISLICFPHHSRGQKLCHLREPYECLTGEYEAGGSDSLSGNSVVGEMNCYRRRESLALLPQIHKLNIHGIHRDDTRLLFTVVCVCNCPEVLIVL